MTDYIYKKLKLKKDRFHLFTYISQGLKNGGTIAELLFSIAENYKYTNKQMYKYVIATHYNMEELGDSESEAMLKAGLISEEEKNAIEHIFNSEPYKAMDYLNEKTSSEDNLRWAVLMLFFPTLLVLLLYIIFQPELKEMTEAMLSPVNSISTKQIEIPDWFKNRQMFTNYLILTLGVMFSFFGLIEYLKRKNIKLLFKLFKIKEREFILNNFEVMLSLMKSGQSLMRSVELISEKKNDHVTNVIFSEIRSSMQEGDKFMYEVLRKYGIDSATISYIMSGEKNNSLNLSIESVVAYNRSRYDQMVKKLSTYLPLTGEIVMSLIILLPLIDIINVTTIGAMNFEI